jgi:hypothetical protein
LVRIRRKVTWFDHHRRSKKLAAAAQSSLLHGDETMARQLFAQAAQEAERALAIVPREKQVTRGVVAMFAARWWRRAHRSEEAARMARLIRGAPDLFPVTLSPLDGPVPASAPRKRP